MDDNSTHGLLIVIEGIDGTGKSSQVKLLVQNLIDGGASALGDREPSDGPFGKILRQSMTEGRLEPEKELELFYKDRQQHVNDVITPALNNGSHVVLDRYYFSTMAYQGANGFNIEKIRKENEAFAPTPDLLFILDLDIETAMKRIGARGDTANEFEQRESLEFCRNVFLSVKDEAYAHILDASQAIEVIHAQIIAVVRSALNYN